ncbi:hypothetical protein GCM10027275_22480 [Rhabdobacter roseus]|uniref:DUF3108 domain-containing protein n=1 Tax=Rhabdobacter roseus TaxID=1655419 RepID=A0A840TSE0_9BACT|nr:hypothetical protein [Rhabdobacter roseus]MBB5284183.1 hypothetical protein [Rhabdobacter roseus]
MKKIATLFTALFFAASFQSKAQSCMGVPMKEGSGYEMISYDGKGKASGTITYKITKVSSEGGLTLVEMNMQSMDKKGKEQMTNTYKLRCDGNQMMLDASSMLGEEQQKMFQNFEMKMTSNDIVYPGKLTAGQTLKDASMHGEGSSGPLAMTFDMDIKNRKVEAQEKVTVPAGTFDAHKITSDMTVKSKMGIGMTLDFQSVSYRAPGVLWDVKTESYRKGKLVGYTELSKIF